MSNYTYYVNGEFVDADAAGVSFHDLGFVRGYGVFDFLRTYGRAPFRLIPHLERLQRSAAAIDLECPWSVEELERICLETLARSPGVQNVSIRPVLTGGYSGGFLMPGDKPSLYVLIAPLSASDPRLFTEGASLVSVDYERFLPSVKSLNYITAIRALKKARAAGAAEALYRTKDGHITECTTSNFFIFRDGRLITSDVDVLDGITRRAALDAAEDMYEIDYRLITYDELGSADEAFITSTTKEILPIVRVDSVTIGDGRVGMHTQRLMEALSALVRQETATRAAVREK
jgi:branched-chain amino acid aminotransferase